MKERAKNKYRKIKDKYGRAIKLLVRLLACLTALIILTVAVCNIIVVATADDYILSFERAAEIEGVDCIIVLGAGLRADGSMSPMLSERVAAGAELYFAGASDRILVSGDHSRVDYNEVGAMKDYMTSVGIDPSVVFTDHAGLDTYDTMYRARDIFKAKRVLIVTQEFHLSRAVYIARSLGLEAFGYACDPEDRFSGLGNLIRESAARTKYVFDSIIEPQPKYLGEEIPIWGNSSASDG